MLYGVEEYVIVSRVALEDLCALAERATHRISVYTTGPEDSLVMAIRCSVREIRILSVLDPGAPAESATS